MHNLFVYQPIISPNLNPTLWQPCWPIKPPNSSFSTKTTHNLTSHLNQINQVHIPPQTPIKSPSSKVTQRTLPNPSNVTWCLRTPIFHSMDRVGGLILKLWHCVSCRINLPVKLLLLHLLTVIGTQVLCLPSKPRNLTIDQLGHPSTSQLLHLHL